MSVLAECPRCRKKQSTKNKQCKCGQDLDKAKRSKKVRYWISYRMPSGKQRRESVGAFEGLDPYSITDAREALSKRVVQKKERRIFDMLPESEINFDELSKWYLNLKTVKKLASYDRIETALSNFNAVFGNRKIDTVKRTDLEAYQEMRAERGKAPATIDMEISLTKTMIIKAFDDDKLDGRILKVFRAVKRKLKKGANARNRILTFDEYTRLVSKAPSHLKAALVIAFNTGMRLGEIRQLKWGYIDRKAGFIRLPKDMPKEKKAKAIPINHHVQAVLKSIPRALRHDFVITYKGKPITQKDGLKRSFATACKEAEIPCGRKTPDGITFHDIRRTVKTNMLEAGISKVYRDKILGHSLQGMDVHYMAPNEESLKTAMNQYTQWIDAQIEVALEKSRSQAAL